MTKNPKIWLEYLCWKIQFWMMFHKPYLPIWLRVFIFKRFPESRYHMNWRTYHFWMRQGWIPKKEFTPLPWPICESAFGPFVKPWNRIQGWFRQHTGGRSHRCEFTDRKRGALYGGTEGGYMDKLFEKFIQNISTEELTDGRQN